MDKTVLDDFKSRFDGWSPDELVDVDRVLAEFVAFARVPSLADGSFSGGDQIFAEASVWDAAAVEFADEHLTAGAAVGDITVVLSRDIPTHDEHGDYDGRLAAGVAFHIAAKDSSAVPADLMVSAELDGPVDDSPTPDDYERGTYLRSVGAFEQILRRQAPGLFTVPIVRLGIDELQEVD